MPKARQFPKVKPEPYPPGSPETASPSLSNGSGKPSTIRVVSTETCTTLWGRVDQIPRILKPAVRVVDDAALLVLNDPVAVDEPLQRRPPVDLILVRRGRDAPQAHMVVDAKARLFAVIESHGARADPEMLRAQFTKLRWYNFQGMLCTGFVTEMQFRNRTPGLGKAVKIGSEGNMRQSLRQIVGEALPVDRRM